MSSLARTKSHSVAIVACLHTAAELSGHLSAHHSSGAGKGLKKYWAATLGLLTEPLTFWLLTQVILEQKDERDKLQAACLVLVRNKHHALPPRDASDHNDLALRQKFKLANLCLACIRNAAATHQVVS